VYLLLGNDRETINYTTSCNGFTNKNISMATTEHSNNERDVSCLVRAEMLEAGTVRELQQGEPRRRKFKRLKLGGGQAYHRSSV
jgi:hypothetical protein